MRRRATTGRRRSPWDLDPLSWLAVPNLPLAAMTITVLYGATTLVTDAHDGGNRAAQALGILLAALGMLWVHLSTRPRRGPLTWGRTVVAVALVGAGFLLSAVGYRGEAFALELWWAPLASSLLILGMAPYCGPLRIVGSGMGLVIAATGSAIVLDASEASAWPPAAILTLIVSPIVLATAGAVAFISTVTTRLTLWSERPWREHAGAQESAELAQTFDPVADEVDGQTSAQLTEAVNLLGDILERGLITPADQQSAMFVASRLRAELLASANDSWLERMARGRPLRVDDPDRLADRLGVPQRTALRALLDALFENPESGFISARIELKAPVEETIAVALRILTTLAEGRRVTFLAPYYVNLQSTVTGIQWRNGSAISVDFTATTDEPRTVAPVAQRQAQLPE